MILATHKRALKYNPDSSLNSQSIYHHFFWNYLSDLNSGFKYKGFPGFPLDAITDQFDTSWQK